MFEYAVSILKTHYWINDEMVDVVNDPRQNELKSAIEILQNEVKKYNKNIKGYHEVDEFYLPNEKAGEGK